jgi:hypothetical protein
MFLRDALERVKLRMFNITEKKEKDNRIDRDRVRLYPEMLLSAAKNGQGGAVRLYFLAKHYDQPKGYGLISGIGFRDWVINKLKWTGGTFYRYLSEAEQLGIIERKGKKLRLAAGNYAAEAAGCMHLGPNSLQTIKLKDLAGKDWRLFTYAAFMVRFNGKNIATATIEQLTGIPARTIYHYDKKLSKKGGIKKRRNYGYWDKEPDQWKICELALHKGQHLFEYGGRILRSLPGARFIYATIARPPKHTQEIKGKLKKVSTINGQRKRFNNKLHAMAFNSSLSGGTKRERVKLYINDPKAKDRKAAARELKNVLIKKQLQGINTVDDVFMFEFEKHGAGFYVAL